MPPSPTLSVSQIEVFKGASSVLHLLHHRNRNQHHAQPWWKHVSLLRRHIDKLLAEIEEEADVLSTTVSKGKGNARRVIEQRERARRKVLARIGFLKEMGVRSCWRAFTNLTGNKRYAAIGLVLVAVTARAARAVGFEVEEHIDGDELRGEVIVSGDDGGDEGAERVGETEGEGGEDEGVAVRRSAVDETTEAAVVTKRKDEVVIKKDELITQWVDSQAQIMCAEVEKRGWEPKRTPEHQMMCDEAERRGWVPKRTTEKDKVGMRERVEERRAKKMKKRREGAAGDIDDLFSGLV